MELFHRRLAVVTVSSSSFKIKNRGINSPILHNTRDGSDFYVPYLSHYI